jgi:hypothetical protein
LTSTSQKLGIRDEVAMNRGRQDRRRDAPRRFASPRYEASAIFAAIVAWAHQTSSSKADFVAASRLASMSSMGLFAPIGEVDMKSPPPMWTEAAVETIPSAIAIWRERFLPSQCLGVLAGHPDKRPFLIEERQWMVAKVK